MKNAKKSCADIWYQIQVKWKDKLCELFCGPTLNYDRNDNKHDRKTNNHDNDIDSYETNHDYNNNYNNDNKSSEIETKRQRNIFEVLAFYFQR